MKKPKHDPEPVEAAIEPLDVPPNLTVAANTIGPIIGVVDGSDAAPGEVGEFLTAVGSFAYAAGTVSGTTSTGTINLITMPPGDWDLTVSASFTNVITAAVFYLNPPTPTGMSNSMAGLNADYTLAGTEETIIIGQCARGSFAVTTNLTFFVQVYNQSQSEPAGTMDIRIEARRRR